MIGQSYDEGFKIGVLQGNKEGYHLGYHRGAEIGAEIGFYLGLVEKYIDYYSKFEETPTKIINSLEVLKKLTLDFPKINSDEIDLFGLLNNIRTRFKKLCAQMKINISYPEKNNLNF